MSEALGLEHKILLKLGPRAKSILHSFRLVFVSEIAGRESLLWQILSALSSEGRRVLDHWGLPEVARFHEINKKVAREIHRYQGLVRFQEKKAGIFVAEIEPDHGILPFLGPHFSRRMGNLNWMIFDSRRAWLLGHEPPGPCTFWTEAQWLEGSQTKDPQEAQFQALWKEYHRKAAVPGRENPRVQKAFMPRRYWKHLVEMEG